VTTGQLIVHASWSLLLLLPSQHVPWIHKVGVEDSLLQHLQTRFFWRWLLNQLFFCLKIKWNTCHLTFFTELIILHESWSYASVPFYNLIASFQHCGWWSS
jgi:hypothetical protein